MKMGHGIRQVMSSQVKFLLILMVMVNGILVKILTMQMVTTNGIKIVRVVSLTLIVMVASNGILVKNLKI